MADEIRKLLAKVVEDESEIHWVIDSTSERLWIDNPETVADAIVNMLENNGYQIARKDELARVKEISNNTSWYEEYRRGMNF